MKCRNEKSTREGSVSSLPTWESQFEVLDSHQLDMLGELTVCIQKGGLVKPWFEVMECCGTENRFHAGRLAIRG